MKELSPNATLDQHEEAWAKIHDLLAAGHWARAREIFDQAVSSTQIVTLPKPYEALPCPMCGAQPRVVDLGGWEVICDCGLDFCSHTDPSKEGALAGWNSRTLAPSATLRIDLSRYINAADISAADVPHVVVEKLQSAIDATSTHEDDCIFCEGTGRMEPRTAEEEVARDEAPVRFAQKCRQTALNQAVAACDVVIAEYAAHTDADGFCSGPDFNYGEIEAIRRAIERIRAIPVME